MTTYKVMMYVILRATDEDAAYAWGKVLGDKIQAEYPEVECADVETNGVEEEEEA